MWKYEADYLLCYYNNFINWSCKSKLSLRRIKQGGHINFPVLACNENGHLTVCN